MKLTHSCVISDDIERGTLSLFSLASDQSVILEFLVEDVDKEYAHAAQARAAYWKTVGQERLDLSQN